MKHLKKFEKETYFPSDIKDFKSEITLQEAMDEFYEEYEDSYIDGNTHGVIVKLIEHLQRLKLLKMGKWEIRDEDDE